VGRFPKSTKNASRPTTLPAKRELHKRRVARNNAETQKSPARQGAKKAEDRAHWTSLKNSTRSALLCSERKMGKSSAKTIALPSCSPVKGKPSDAFQCSSSSGWRPPGESQSVLAAKMDFSSNPEKGNSWSHLKIGRRLTTTREAAERNRSQTAVRYASQKAACERPHGLLFLKGKKSRGIGKIPPAPKREVHQVKSSSRELRSPQAGIPGFP